MNRTLARMGTLGTRQDPALVLLLLLRATGSGFRDPSR